MYRFPEEPTDTMLLRQTNHCYVIKGIVLSNQTLLFLIKNTNSFNYEVTQIVNY